MKVLLCLLVSLPALATADARLNRRFDTLSAQSRDNTQLNLERINERLSNAAQLNTAALNLEGNVTTADRLGAAISTTVDGVESGLAIDLVGLAAGRKQPHAVVMTLGKLSDDGVRSGIGYAFQHTPAATVGDYCRVTAAGPKNKAAYEGLRARFVKVCTAAKAFVPTPGNADHHKWTKIARQVCGFEIDPTRTAADQNMTWAGINLSAWVAKTQQTQLADDTAKLESFLTLKPCTDAEAEANLRVLRNAMTTHAVGFGLMTDWFPIRGGTQLEDETAKRAGSVLEPYENFKSGALLLEGRHGTTLWQVTYGASLKTFREAPRDVDRKTALAPRLSGEMVLASLGKMARASLGPNDPRMALGLDTTVDAQLSEDDDEPADIGRVRKVAATLRLDTTINPQVKVRLALPITWTRAVIAADDANAAKVGWAFSIPASIVTVLRF